MKLSSSTRTGLWGLGLAVVLTAIITDRDWRREQAYESMAKARGEYQ